MIPEYDVAVVDEAHELVSRVTQAATDELAVPDIERTSRRAQRHVDGSEADDLADASEVLRRALDATEAGRIDRPSEELADALTLVRDAARALVSAFPKEAAGGGGGQPDAASVQAKGWAQELFKTAERMAAGSEKDALVGRRAVGGPQRPRQPQRLPSVARLRWPVPCASGCAPRRLASTSATLKLGGDFDQVAASLGLSPKDRVSASGGSRPRAPGRDSTWARPSTTASRRSSTSPGTCLPPGRDGLTEAHLREITELVDAAGGRTLGLFSSRGRPRPRPSTSASSFPPDHARPGRRAA